MRVAVFVLVAAVLAPASAPAHSATSVSVYNNFFTPTPARAEPGHDVTWTWNCETYGAGCAGVHNVTAWEGATFASGDRGYPASFTATFPAGPSVVKYRCTLHSSLTAGQCSGMCGVLGLDAQKPTASISSPRENEVRTAASFPVPVTFEGTASDDVGVVKVVVRVYDVLGRATDRDATCVGGCGGSSVGWMALVPLSPGTYLVDATAYDALGNSARTARVRFFVL